MQDGIILPIINKYRMDYKKYSEYDYRTILDLVHQELIEKIRQHHFDDDAYFNDSIKQVLIGDTT